jgi:hypothetical protein
VHSAPRARDRDIIEDSPTGLQPITAVALSVGAGLTGGTLASILTLSLTSATSSTGDLRAHTSFRGGFSTTAGGIKEG